MLDGRDGTRRRAGPVRPGRARLGAGARADRPDGPARRRVGGAPGGAAPGRAGRAARGGRRTAVPGPPPAARRPAPAPRRRRPVAASPHVPAVDSYSLRLVSTRRLYDGGRAVSASPSLTPLVALGGGPGQPLRPRPAGRGRPATRCGCARPAARSCCRPRPTPGCPGAWSPSTSTCRPHRRPGRGHHQRRRRPDRRGGRGQRGPAGVGRDDAVLWARSSPPTGDPLYANGVGWFVWVVDAHQGAGGLRRPAWCSVMLMIWFERKVISDMQSRIGPNRAGPWGLLQTLADGIKLFFKEDLAPGPGRPVRLQAGALPVAHAGPAHLHRGAGRGASSPSPATPSSCRWPTRRSASSWCWPCRPIAVYGVMLAGWSSGSKYPLLGSVRASAQMISYEAALGITVVMVVLDHRLAVDPGDRRRPRPTNFWDWNVIRLGLRALLPVLDRHHRRAAPARPST